MPKLHELAKVLRSKNAGPYCLTLDVMFGEESTYRAVIAAGVLDAEVVAERYAVDPSEVRVFNYDPAYAVKISLPRRPPSGDPTGSDVLGCQAHRPIFDLDVPGDAS